MEITDQEIIWLKIISCSCKKTLVHLLLSWIGTKKTLSSDYFSKKFLCNFAKRILKGGGQFPDGKKTKIWEFQKVYFINPLKTSPFNEGIVPFLFLAQSFHKLILFPSPDEFLQKIRILYFL